MSRTQQPFHILLCEHWNHVRASEVIGYTTDCPRKKMIIGLSASITFEIVNYKHITNYLHFGENPIRFGSVKMWIFVRYVILSPFHPIFVNASTNTIQKQCGIQCSLCSVSLLSVNIWKEGTYDMPYKNPYFFVTPEPNRMGFSLRCR